MDNLEKPFNTHSAPSPHDALAVGLPVQAQAYVAHVHGSYSIRALARYFGKHPSTVLRQVRRMEAKREDPLVDAGLDHYANTFAKGCGMKQNHAKDFAAQQSVGPMSSTIATVLEYLKVPGTVLALAQDLDKAIVVRDGPHGCTERLSIVDRADAMAMALQDWIMPDDPRNRIVRYRITPAGRVALRDSGSGQEDGAFADTDAAHPRANRYGAPETPLMQLARRKDRNGQAYVSSEQVRAGERLREDFELAQLDPDRPTDWSIYCEAGPANIYCGGVSAAARAHGRVAAAFAVLGPGLGDVALSCCCGLEGLEKAEKQFGWAARSGKIVLRIALTHLVRHYEGQADDKMIG